MRAYGTLELTDASPAQTFTEILSLAEVKAYLRITDSSPVDSAQDTMLEGFIAAAREMAEICQGKDLISKQYDLTLDLMEGYETIRAQDAPIRTNNVYSIGLDYEINLRQPLTSVDLFTYKDSDEETTTLVEDTDYIVDTVRGLVKPVYGETWPTFVPHPSSAVLIRFTSGYTNDHPFWSNAGQRIKVGMLMLMALWYDERIPLAPRRDVSELPYGIKTLLGYGHTPRVF